MFSAYDVLMSAAIFYAAFSAAHETEYGEGKLRTMDEWTRIVQDALEYHNRKVTESNGPEEVVAMAGVWMQEYFEWMRSAN